MISTITWAIHTLANLAFILIIAKVFLSYFMNPYHPVRKFIDRIVNPVLAPIQKIVPLVGNIDFSPIILLLLIQLVEYLLVRLIGLVG
jgi:YggT family protein